MPQTLIKQALDDEAAMTFYQSFVDNSGHKKRYLMGTTSLALEASRKLDFDGFIDDFTDSKELEGKPIIKTENLPEGALVVSMVVNARPWTAARKLDELGISHLDYFSFYRCSDIDLPSPFFWDSFKEEFDQHQGEYLELHDLLSDDESKKQLTDLLNFRYLEDMRWLEGYAFMPEKQYFEDFLSLKDTGESFADVGAFDGFTSMEFIRHCPGYTAVHVFEPEEQNMLKAKSNLSRHQNVHYHPYGLSNEPKTLRFTAAGSASRFCEDGEIEIRLDKLDSLVQTPLSFIKMDIEGGELGAIEGAREAIKRHHPKLAIAAYHKIDDFRTITKAILSIRSDYRVYLRHYTESMTETVLFFIPE